MNACAFNPDGRCILSVSDDTTVRLWDVATGAAIHTLQGHTRPVRACSFSLDGRRVVSAAEDTTLRLWDVATGAALQVFQVRHPRGAYICVFTPDGEMVLSNSGDGLQLWQVATIKELACWPRGDSAIRRIALSRDGTRIVAGDEGGCVHFLTIIHNEHRATESHQ